MQNSALLKSKKIQVAVLAALTGAVILFSLLTEFPEGDGQGSLRNKRFGPVVQPRQTQQTPVQTGQPGNINSQIPVQGQGYDLPDNGNITDGQPIPFGPAANGYDLPDNGN